MKLRCSTFDLGENENKEMVRDGGQKRGGSGDKVLESGMLKVGKEGCEWVSCRVEAWDAM